MLWGAGWWRMAGVWRRAAATTGGAVWVHDACRESFLFFIKWMHMHDMKWNIRLKANLKRKHTCFFLLNVPFSLFSLSRSLFFLSVFSVYSLYPCLPLFNLYPFFIIYYFWNQDGSEKLPIFDFFPLLLYFLFFYNESTQEWYWSHFPTVIIFIFNYFF